MSILRRFTVLSWLFAVGACTSDALPDGASGADRARALFDDDLGIEGLDMAAPCANGTKDGDEADVDCGGPMCAQCGLGSHCLVANDCDTSNCVNGLCASSDHCEDGIRDDLESDIDCGGPVCAYCAAGRACRDDGDCAAATVCSSLKCDRPPALRLAWKDAVSSDTDYWPTSLAAGDLNHDQRPDLVVLNRKSFSVGSYLVRGDGTFLAPRTTPIRGNVENLALADFDGDGDLDFGVGPGNVTGIQVALGMGNGSFAMVIDSAPMLSKYGPWDSGDLDGDGLPDVAVGGNSDVQIGWNQGKGVFVAGPSFMSPKSIDCGPAGANLADLDRDGRLDVLWSCGPDLAFMRNRGRNSFDPVQNLKGVSPVALGRRLLVYDLDRDGYPEVINAGVDVFRGGPKLAFSAPKAYAVTDGFTMVAADFDRDGHLDVVVGGGTKLNILRGTVGAGFTAPTTLSTPAQSILSLVAADLNHDDKPDLAFVDYMASKLWVILNDAR